MFGRGVSWQRRALGATAAVAVMATLGAGPVLAEKDDGGKSGKLVHVIVRLGDGVSVNSKKLMKEFDGKLEADLAPIGGFAGFVPADKLDELRAVAGVTEVTADVSLNGNPTDPVATTSGDDTSGFVDGDFGRKGA